MRKIAIVAISCALCGCAYGIKEGKTYPQETFTMNSGYQAAFRLLDAQPRECVGNATVSGNLYSDNQTGVVRASLPPYSDGDALRIDLSADGPDRTVVKVKVMDVGLYDAAMIDAIKKTAASGKVVCRDGAYWNTHRVSQ